MERYLIHIEKYRLRSKAAPHNVNAYSKPTHFFEYFSLVIHISIKID